ncbi:MAG: cytochrome c1 [Gallionella sp.]|jgi:cytochrome c1
MSKLLMMVLLCSFNAWAADAGLEKITVETDLPALERGADALMNDCHSCHSLKYIKYRDLASFGLDKQKVDAWRGDQTLDAPLLATMSESDAMLAFGKAPPDLSLMARARDGGASYVYSYLVGYYMTPEGIPGNHIYPATRMPDPLGISSATDSKRRTEIEGRARSIVSFLAWAADPHGAERIRLGYYVIAYLIVLTTLLYFVKNLIWSRLKRSSI